MAKCAECGFLTLRDEATGLLVEVIDDYRVSGRVPDIAAYRRYHNYPICFAMAWDLIPEVEEAAQSQVTEQNNDWGEYVLEVITKDRDCVTTDKTLGYTKYQQGFTPKEHMEMLDRQWLLDFQSRREQADREWREEQRHLDLEWREEQEKKASKRHRWDLIVFGLIVTSILSVTTIIAAYIERNSL